MQKNETTWRATIESVPALPRLDTDLSTDVCVIGSGIAGITTAYFLAKEGKRVVVIEKETLLETTTAYTSACITSIIDTDLTDLKATIGKKGVAQVIRSGEEAISIIEAIVAQENISCEFKRVPHYSVAFSHHGINRFIKDEAILRDLGFKTKVHLDSNLPFRNEGYVEMSNQAKFHPIKYLLGLRSVCEHMGVQFFEHTKAKKLSRGMPGTKSIVHLYNKRKIMAGNVVIATYNVFQQPWWYLFKKGMYYSYLMEFLIPAHTLPEMIFEDDQNPYFYGRVDRTDDGDRVLIGGADHRREVPLSQEKCFAEIEQYARHIFRSTPYKIVRRWRGPILEPTDGLPLIGRFSRFFPHRYVATAFSGNGITYGTLSAKINSDLIMGRSNEYVKRYNPSRYINPIAVCIKGRDYLFELFSGIFKNIRTSRRPKKPSVTKLQPERFI